MSNSPEGVADRMISYLSAIAPEEVSPKTISRVLKLNHGTVRKELARLLASKDSVLVRVRRGWYRHKMDVDVIARLDKSKRIELHGIKMEGTCLDANTPYSLVREAKRKYRKRGTYKETFEDRIITITVHEVGLVEIWVNTSANPMNFPQFDRFCAWVKGALSFVFEPSWTLKQIGLNVDVRRLGTDFRSFKLTVFRNAWFQLYQKGEDCTRFETHICPNLKLDEALTILRQLIEVRIPDHSEAYSPPSEDGGDYSYQ